MLAFERQPERPPAQVGRHIQNETGHVGQLDAANIPGGRRTTLVLVTFFLSCKEADGEFIYFKKVLRYQITINYIICTLQTTIFSGTSIMSATANLSLL